MYTTVQYNALYMYVHIVPLVTCLNMATQTISCPLFCFIRAFQLVFGIKRALLSKDGSSYNDSHNKNGFESIHLNSEEM